MKSHSSKFSIKVKGFENSLHVIGHGICGPLPVCYVYLHFADSVIYLVLKFNGYDMAETHNLFPNFQWPDVESLIKELQKVEGIESVSKGRFFLSPGLAPTFQV